MPFKSKAEARQFLLDRGVTEEQIQAALAQRRGEKIESVDTANPSVAIPEATTTESRAKDVGSMVGEIGGGLLGATRGRPDVGATVGAGVGRAGVGAVQDVPELMSGELSNKDFAWRAGQEFARGSGESVLSNAVFRGARWIAAPLARKLTPQAKDFIEYMHAKLPDLPSGTWSDPVGALRHPINTARKMLGVTKPAPATPDILTDSLVLDIGGNIVRTTMFGGGSVRALDTRNARIMGEAAEDLGKAFGSALPRDRFGVVVEAAVNDRISGAEMARQTAKNTIVQLMPTDATVGMAGVVAPIKKAVRLGKKLAADPDLPLNMVDSFQQEMLDKLGPNPPLDAVMEFRDLLRVKGKEDMLPVMDKAIAKSLGKNKQALKAFKDYQSLEHMTEGAEGALNTKFINGVLSTIKGRGGYEAVADMLKPGNVSTIRRLRSAMETSFPGSTALGNPWKHVQAEFNQRLLNSAMVATEKGAKELRGARLLASIQAPETQELIREVYGKDHLKNLTNFAKNLTESQAKGLAGGRGKFMVEMREGGLISNITGGLLETLGLGLGSGAIGAGLSPEIASSAALIAAGPTIVGRAFTDPVIVKWLSEGLAHPRLFGKTRMASAAGSRFLRAEAEEIFLDNASQGDYERQFIQQKAGYPAGMMP